jgi:hypothetical protein
MSDYELLHDVTVGTKPKENKESDSSALDHSTVAKAVEHGRPDALGAKGALHLQRMAGNAAMGSLVQRDAEESPVKDVVGKGGGSTLDKGVRQDMEARLGHDFSDVRIHTDSKAAQAATSVQAKAFTTGNEVVFNSGNYQPDTSEGKHMLAHELTHVVQQRSGPVDGTSDGKGNSVSNPSDSFEREAEANASKAMSGDAHAGHDHAPAAAGAGVQRDAEADADVQTMRDTSIQRDDDEKESSPVESEGEDEKVQGMFDVQRSDDEKESDPAESEGEDEKVQGMFEVQRDESEEKDSEE